MAHGADDGDVGGLDMSAYALEDGAGETLVKAEEDDCLVEPPRQDSLEESESRIDEYNDGETAAQHEDDLEVVEGEEHNEEDEGEVETLTNPALHGNALPGTLVCGSKSCVDQGVPCPPCAKHNKGIAACFAQGHLYLAENGEVPSSCKDCKQRNKGALFCFKRGHMIGLRAMLPATMVPAGMVLARKDAVSNVDLDDDAEEEEEALEAQSLDAQELDGDGDDDLSGPVSPADDECTL